MQFEQNSTRAVAEQLSIQEKVIIGLDANKKAEKELCYY